MNSRAMAIPAGPAPTMQRSRSITVPSSSVRLSIKAMERMPPEYLRKVTAPLEPETESNVILAPNAPQ